MSLLTIVNDAQAEIGIKITGNVIGSVDANTQTLLAMANAAGRFISRAHDWQALLREKTFTTTAAETQAGAISSDFDRFVNQTMYNRTTMEYVFGPLTAQEWQNYKTFGTGPTSPYFRQRANAIQFIAMPPADQTIVYEYITKNWARSADLLTQKCRFSDDGDTACIPEELVTFKIIERFLERKGMDSTEAAMQFRRELEERVASDGGRRMIDASRGRAIIRAGQAHVQEGSWPL